MKAYVDDCETHFLNSVKFLKQKVTWFISDFFIINTFIRRNADGKNEQKKHTALHDRNTHKIKYTQWIDWSF